MPVPRQQDRRHHPRARMSWPVLVKVETNRYLASSVDISTHGAKVRTKALLKSGTTVQLELVPPEGPPLRVGALVWRGGVDGLGLRVSPEVPHRILPATQPLQVSGRFLRAPRASGVMRGSRGDGRH